MARKPAMTIEQAEQQVAMLCNLPGPAVRPVSFQHLRDKDLKEKIRLAVRRWFSAKGISSRSNSMLTYFSLEKGYNDPDGSVFAEILKKHQEAVSNAKEESDEDEPAPVPVPTPHTNGNGAMPDNPAIVNTSEAEAIKVLRNLLGGGAVNREQVTRIVRDEIANVAFPRDVVVRVNDQPAITLPGQHPVFDTVVNYIVRGGNVMLVGPAGCGKTHLAGQVAKALGRDYGFISATAGASESHLTGWLLPADGGRFEYSPSQFVELYERGNAIYCFDEFDAFDPNMIMVTNSATANGHMNVPHRRGNTLVTRGPNMGFIATCNTFGTGSDPVYVSRIQQDGAALDRWMVVEMDYDKSFEEKLALSRGLTVSELTEIWTLRDKAREAKLRRVVSTRAIQKAAISKEAGETWNDTMAMLLCGWTKDEKAKVGQVGR